MKIAVVNGHWPNYEPLAKLTTYGNRTEYCKRWGYQLFVKTGDWKMPACHPVTWDRFAFMRDIVASGKFDWVWCSGTDTLHTNFTIPLESFTDKRSHVVASCEWCSPFQADSFLVRNSPEGIAWMDDILSMYPAYKDNVWVEQQAIIVSLPKWQKIMKLLPQRAMNAYDYGLYKAMYSGEPAVQNATDYVGADAQWHPGDFLIHWPSIPLKKRLELVKMYTPQIVK